MRASPNSQIHARACTHAHMHTHAHTHTHTHTNACTEVYMAELRTSFLNGVLWYRSKVTHTMQTMRDVVWESACMHVEAGVYAHVACVYRHLSLLTLLPLSLYSHTVTGIRAARASPEEYIVAITGSVSFPHANTHSGAHTHTQKMCCLQVNGKGS